LANSSRSFFPAISDINIGSAKGGGKIKNVKNA
jgi:hypothetical protein